MRTPRVIHVHMCTCVLVCMCARVRTWARGHVGTCVCINNEIAPFLGFLLSHYVHIPYIHARSYDFLLCETIFLFLFTQVTWRLEESPIVLFNCDC